jgi:hypothetical protein
VAEALQSGAVVVVVVVVVAVVAAVVVAVVGVAAVAGTTARLKLVAVTVDMVNNTADYL